MELLRFGTIANTAGLDRFLRAPIFPGNIEAVGEVAAGTLDIAGEVDLGAAVIMSGLQTIAAGGTTTAASLEKSVIEVGADVGGDIVTIADGTVGQRMVLVCIDATGTTTITPATFNGGTSVTFDAVGDSVEFIMGSLGWSIIGGNSYTIT